MRGTFELKDEALDRTMWRTRFGRDCGPVVRQTAKCMNKMAEIKGIFRIEKIKKCKIFCLHTSCDEAKW